MMRSLHSGQDLDAVKNAKFSWATVSRAWQFVRPYRFPLIACMVAVAVTSGLGVLPALIFRQIIDQAIPRHSMHDVYSLVGFAAIVLVAGRGIGVFSTWAFSRVAYWVTYDLRTRLFDHIQRMPISFFTRTQTGSVLTRILTDVETAQSLFTGDLGSFVSVVFSLGFTMAAMLALSWQVTIALLVGVPMMVVPSKWMGNKLRLVVKGAMERRATLNTVSAERFNVAGALVVKLFGSYRLELERFAESAAALRSIGIRRNVYMAVFSAALAMVSIFGTVVVYLLGARAVIEGAASIGTIVALATYAGQLYAPVMQLSSARVDLMTSLLAFERVFEVIDAPLAIVDAPDAVDLVSPAGRVELEAVWFRYPPNVALIPSLEAEGTKGARAGGDAPEEDGAPRGQSAPEEQAWVLSGVSLVAEPGTMTALVGPTGAGKTTLCQLVPRLYDVVSGRVKVDGADVRAISHESLSSAIGVVTQDVHLFHQSVAENLRYAKPDATDEEMVAACKAAQVHDLIASLADGYDTVVGEKGYRFSGGEKQRLAIARVLLKDPAIVILDEATAHLDSETEAQVQEALLNALAGRTSLVIAHRLSTVRAADQILVLDGGRIVERGTHEELVALGGTYAELYRTQFAEGPAEADDTLLEA